MKRCSAWSTLGSLLMGVVICAAQAAPDRAVAAPTYAISGTITLTGASDNSRAIVTVSDTAVSPPLAYYPAVTAADGTYSISGLQASTYSVTVVRAGWRFTPPSCTVQLQTSGATSVDFSGEKLPGLDFLLLGSAGWTDTGVRVDAGQRVRIAASGSIMYGTEGAPLSGYAYTDPDGNRFARGMTFPPKIELGCPLSSAPVGAVIAAIALDAGGRSPAFLVGSDFDASATATGQLCLLYNDTCRGDNEGAYEVHIRAQAPPSQPTAATITPSVPGKEDLTGNADGSADAEGDDITYEYQWAKVNPAGGYLTMWVSNPGRVLPASKVNFGETWRVRARAFDGTDYSPWKPGKTAKIVRMVTYTTPAANATNVPTNSLIQLTFKWPVDQLSVNRRLRVYCGTSLVAGSARWIVPNLKVRFVPKARLRSNTSYQIRLASGVTCTNSRMLNWAETYDFTTAGPAGTPAMSIAATPTAAGAQITLNLTSAATVRTAICNIAGRVVAELPERDLPAGVTSLTWTGRSSTGTKVPPGMYLVRVSASTPDGQQTDTVAPLMLRR